jgi:hypothetical protein
MKVKEKGGIYAENKWRKPVPLRRLVIRIMNLLNAEHNAGFGQEQVEDAVHWLLQNHLLSHGDGHLCATQDGKILVKLTLESEDEGLSHYRCYVSPEKEPRRSVEARAAT